MVEENIKREAIKALQEALGSKDKICKKAIKKNKFLAKQWKDATEMDIEIVYMPETQVVSEFSCRADRYYKWIYSDGVTGEKRKNKPVNITSKELGFTKQLHNVKSDNFTEMMRDLYTYKFYNRQKSRDVYVLYNGKWDELDFLDWHKEMEPLAEKQYRIANETCLYNNPEKLEEIVFSELIFTKWETLEKGPMAALFLRIKDEKGEDLKMYIGKYSLIEQELLDITPMHIEYPWIYDKEGRERKLKK